MPKSRRKKRSAKRVFALPDLKESKAAVLNSAVVVAGKQVFLGGDAVAAWSGHLALYSDLHIAYSWAGGECMNRRIGWWMVAGFVVACCWAAIVFVVGHRYNFGRSLALEITAPASILGRHMPLKWYWFVLLNGGLYAFVGLMVELFRKLLPGRPAHA